MTLRKSPLLKIVFFSLVGAALSLYATSLTFRFTVAGLIEPSACSFSDIFTCDTVLSTSYAKMFGVPVAWFGFMYFLWTFFVAIFALIKKGKQSGVAAIDILLFVTSLSVLFTFFKIYQLIKLGVICPVCVGMYVCTYIIFFMCINLRETNMKNIFKLNADYFRSIFSREEADERYKDFLPAEAKISNPWRYWVIFIWLLAMGFLGLRYYENTVIKPGLSKITPIIAKHYEEKVVEINTDDAAFFGNRESNVKVVEFTDFECPSCRLLSLNMKSVMLEYGDRVGFYFMNYPLDKTVNQYVSNDMHKNAGIAALAGICANDQGKFLEFHDLLFENQTSLRLESLEELAGEVGMNVEEMKVCMQSESTIARLKQQIETGKKAGVDATPYLFINGRRVYYWNSPEVIRSIIEEELKKE